MDGTWVPYAWVPGYQVTLPARSLDTHVMCLSWSCYRNQINLADFFADYYLRLFSAPVVRSIAEPVPLASPR